MWKLTNSRRPKFHARALSKGHKGRRTGKRESLQDEAVAIAITVNGWPRNAVITKRNAEETRLSFCSLFLPCLLTTFADDLRSGKMGVGGLVGRVSVAFHNR